MCINVLHTFRIYTSYVIKKFESLGVTNETAACSVHHVESSPSREEDRGR